VVLRRLRGFWPCIAFCLLLGLWQTSPAQANDPPPSRPLLRVATGQALPFVVSQNGVLTGFSIDLWAYLAQRMRVATSFTDLGPRSDEAQLQAVERGEADLAISALITTPAREARVDFTSPIFDSGLQIMVRTSQADDTLMGTLRIIFSPAVGNLLLGGVGIILGLAHLLWLVERGHNPLFQRGYLRGVLEGIWGVTLIFATGEHGDRDAPGWVKRITIAFMWLFGVVLIAQFTANVTSSLTVRQLQSNIQGPADLPGKSIATRPDSVAAEYLTQRGLSFIPVQSAEDAFDALTSGRAQAVVFDAPTLRYLVNLRGDASVQLVGPVFRPERFAIAVPLGSPLRKEINQALLGMEADGSFEEIRRRWFSQ
jgi:polar amino acid transport system substrate-binding protein